MTRQVVRIVLRYGVALVAGWEASDMVVNDPDLLDVATLAVSALVAIATEWWFARDVKDGRA